MIYKSVRSGPSPTCGCSSVVEHLLAKERVESSNLFIRLDKTAISIIRSFNIFLLAFHFLVFFFCKYSIGSSVDAMSFYCSLLSLITTFMLLLLLRPSCLKPIDKLQHLFLPQSALASMDLIPLMPLMKLV